MRMLPDFPTVNYVFGASTDGPHAGLASVGGMSTSS